MPLADAARMRKTTKRPLGLDRITVRVLTDRLASVSGGLPKGTSGGCTGMESVCYCTSAYTDYACPSLPCDSINVTC